MPPATSIAVQTARPAWQPRSLRLVWKPAPATVFCPVAELPRRLLNVVVAAIGLVVAAPLMALIAVLIKLTSKGPVLYTQTRIGLDRRDPKVVSLNHRRDWDHGGAPFRIYKFRTMATRPGRADDQVWARPEDPRVTPIGRLLRQYRLGGPPQLVNVLRGGRKLLGPPPGEPNNFLELPGL